MKSVTLKDKISEINMDETMQTKYYEYKFQYKNEHTKRIKAVVLFQFNKKKLHLPLFF